ncbi:hypothetical protein GOHSU_19_00450 [Gordonia hirsuta DSM 44140 = NBRC 16056]|uniref:Uncharacterized protein n=1 Tax=Gordonia hirsuta DSM 44140 = NBRC 16056 TaxID=1121927 RepID=L7L8G9_9ACTN|nr:hypothetical protein [Gordonia hirsuta]GAC57440.1 hypothetical protein GOHSU_19_00450 [Gordonia hirsuta DSM 44140 = NBRC 16056]
MSRFQLTPDQIRALAQGWQQHGASVRALDFGPALSGGAGSVSIAALAACAEAAGSSTGLFGDRLVNLGLVVARFAELSALSDEAAAAGIAMGLDR